jgi:hypothetical protein
MKDIAEELLRTIKYIPKEERQSRWYLEYLEQVVEDLKKENLK